MPPPRVTVVSSGRRYRLGRTDDYGAIWRKRPWGWRIIARYPLTEEGWRVASAQFAMWEPGIGQPPTSGFVRDSPGPPNPHDAVAESGGLMRGRAWHPPMWSWVLAVIVVVLLATGAGLYVGHVAPFTTSASHAPAVTSTTTTSPPAVGTGYLASGSTWVLFIQWTDQGGYLNGSVQEITTTGSPPTQRVRTASIPVSGQVTGSQLTVRFNGGVEVFGTLSAGTFTINFQQPSGTLAPITFHSEPVAQYNAAVSALHAKVTSADAVAERAEQVAQLQTSINQAASTVKAAITSLGTMATSIVTAAQRVGNLVKNVTKALTTTKAALDKQLALMSAGTTSTACYYANETVAYDAREAVAYAARNTVGYAAQTVSRGAKQVATLVTALRAAFATFQSVQAKLSSYVPVQAPSQAEVTSAVNKAQATAAAAISAANGYIDQANADVSTAYGYADQAFQAGNCGTPPSPTTPVPHIT